MDIPLLIEAMSPLLVMGQRLGNVTTCLDHVPGTMLLPIVMRALRKAGVAATEVTRLITSGALSVAPAYAAIGDARGLPIPMRWQWPKQNAVNRKSVKNAPLHGGEAGAAQMAHPRGGEVVADYAARSVRHVVRTQNTVCDDIQRPTEAVGGLYTCEGIRAGEKLASVVRLPKHVGEDVFHRFREQMTGRVRIGAVVRRGYGDVRLQAGNCAPPADRSFHAAESAVLWLTSDLCFPAPIGPSVPDVPGRVPEMRRQLAAAIGHAMGRKVEVTRSWMRTWRHESWHRQWGLPRPSLTLVRAGSVLVIESCAGDGPFTADELRRLEWAGAGERRAEGYGQILVNARETTRTDEFPLSAAQQEEEGKSRDFPDQPVQLSAATGDFARIVETVAWRSYVRLRAEEATVNHDDRERLLGWTRDKPSASQLGKMRGLLNGARTDDDVKAIRTWLKKRPEGWDQAGANLLEVLEDPFAVLERERDCRDAPATLTRSRGDIRKDESLQRYAIAAIMQAALRAHRRAAETSPEPSGGDRRETREAG